MKGRTGGAAMRQSLTEKEWSAMRTFVRRVRDEVPDRDATAIVFGSRARGEGGPESDVDVVVVGATDDLRVRRLIFDLAYEVFLQTDVLISPLVFSRERFKALRQSGRRLARDIERDGVRV